MSERLTAKYVNDRVNYLISLSGLNISFGSRTGHHYVSGGLNFGSKNLRDVANYIEGAIAIAERMRG